MDSNIRKDYNTVVYLDAEGDEIRRTEIIYSSKLKHEFLAMLNANFCKDESLGLPNMMPNELSKSEIEMLSLMSLAQISDEDPSDRYEFYTYLTNAKVCVLRVPRECSQIRFQDAYSDDDRTRDETIDFKVNFTKIENQDIVEKMVIMTTSKDVVDNLIPSIHEASDNPHPELPSKIVTSTKFYSSLTLTEVDAGLLYDNKSLTKLGHAVMNYFKKVDRVLYDPNTKQIYISGL